MAVHLTPLCRGTGLVERDGPKIQLQESDMTYLSSTWERKNKQSRRGSRHRRAKVSETFYTRKGAILLYPNSIMQKKPKSPGDDLHSSVLLQSKSFSDEFEKWAAIFIGEGDLGEEGLLHPSNAQNRQVESLANSQLPLLISADSVIAANTKIKKIRPGLSARRYLINLTEGAESKLHCHWKTKGYVSDSTFYEANTVNPELKRKVKADLSEHPEPYSLSHFLSNTLSWQIAPSDYSLPLLEESVDIFPPKKDIKEELTRVKPRKEPAKGDNKDNTAPTLPRMKKSVDYPKLPFDNKRAMLVEKLVQAAISMAIRKHKELFEMHLKEQGAFVGADVPKAIGKVDTDDMDEFKVAPFLDFKDALHSLSFSQMIKWREAKLKLRGRDAPRYQLQCDKTAPFSVYFPPRVLGGSKQPVPVSGFGSWRNTPASGASGSRIRQSLTKQRQHDELETGGVSCVSLEDSFDEELENAELVNNLERANSTIRESKEKDGDDTGSSGISRLFAEGSSPMMKRILSSIPAPIFEAIESSLVKNLAKHADRIARMVLAKPGNGKLLDKDTKLALDLWKKFLLEPIPMTAPSRRTTRDFTFQTTFTTPTDQTVQGPAGSSKFSPSSCQPTVVHQQQQQKSKLAVSPKSVAVASVDFGSALDTFPRTDSMASTPQSSTRTVVTRQFRGAFDAPQREAQQSYQAQPSTTTTTTTASSSYQPQYQQQQQQQPQKLGKGPLQRRDSQSEVVAVPEKFASDERRHSFKAAKPVVVAKTANVAQAVKGSDSEVLDSDEVLAESELESDQVDYVDQGEVEDENERQVDDDFDPIANLLSFMSEDDPLQGKKKKKKKLKPESEAEPEEPKPVIPRRHSVQPVTRANLDILREDDWSDEDDGDGKKRRRRKSRVKKEDDRPWAGLLTQQVVDEGMDKQSQDDEEQAPPAPAPVRKKLARRTTVSLPESVEEEVKVRVTEPVIAAARKQMGANDSDDEAHDLEKTKARAKLTRMVSQPAKLKRQEPKEAGGAETAKPAGGAKKAQLRRSESRAIVEKDEKPKKKEKTPKKEKPFVSGVVEASMALPRLEDREAKRAARKAAKAAKKAKKQQEKLDAFARGEDVDLKTEEESVSSHSSDDNEDIGQLKGAVEVKVNFKRGRKEQQTGPRRKPLRAKAPPPTLFEEMAALEKAGLSGSLTDAIRKEIESSGAGTSAEKSRKKSRGGSSETVAKVKEEEEELEFEFVERSTTGSLKTATKVTTVAEDISEADGDEEQLETGFLSTLTKEDMVKRRKEVQEQKRRERELRKAEEQRLREEESGKKLAIQIEIEREAKAIEEAARAEFEKMLEERMLAEQEEEERAMEKARIDEFNAFIAEQEKMKKDEFKSKFKEELKRRRTSRALRRYDSSTAENMQAFGAMTEPVVSLPVADEVEDEEMPLMTKKRMSIGQHKAELEARRLRVLEERRALLRGQQPRTHSAVLSRKLMARRLEHWGLLNHSIRFTRAFVWSYYSLLQWLRFDSIPEKLPIIE